VSSKSGDLSTLEKLDQAMQIFYSHPDRRKLYQEMLSAKADEPLKKFSPGDWIIQLVNSNAPKGSVVEVGCGNGWLYRHLIQRGFKGDFQGIDVPKHVIEDNIKRHPETQWSAGSIYSLPIADSTIDICYSHYVLEHTVWPEKAITEMLRVVKPGGRCLLVFPDFVAKRSLPSQQSGFTPGTGRQKLANWRFVDAIITGYDNKFRLRRAIRNAKNKIGPFPVNTRPMCLDYPGLMWADIDAVYLADKFEVADWFRSNGCVVHFPAGTTGEFALHSIVEAVKPH
jgi:ubiquinone/menaquinone biosynthesis C-methylase UbiE